jgi:hypothetical protein
MPLNKVLAALAGGLVTTALAWLAENVGVSFPGLENLGDWVAGAITASLAAFGVAYLTPESQQKIEDYLATLLRRRRPGTTLDGR